MGAQEAVPAPGVPAALAEALAPPTSPWRGACWTLAAAGGMAPGVLGLPAWAAGENMARRDFGGTGRGIWCGGLGNRELQAAPSLKQVQCPSPTFQPLGGGWGWLSGWFSPWLIPGPVPLPQAPLLPPLRSLWPFTPLPQRRVAFCSLVHSFTHSFMHSFIHSLFHPPLLCSLPLCPEMDLQVPPRAALGLGAGSAGPALTPPGSDQESSAGRWIEAWGLQAQCTLVG